MYLDVIERRNPLLIRAATELHQAGELPPNSYVIDLDTIAANASVMAREAERVGIGLYLMTKQFNRNPLVAHAARLAGIESAVAVELQCALALSRYGLSVGHVGHLVQIPRHSIPVVLAMRPEVWTIYSIENARLVSEAACAMGVRQDILVRVRGRDDVMYPNEEGGVWEDELDGFVEQARALEGVRIVGVTGYPGTGYNPTTNSIEPAINLTTTMRHCADRLRELGCEVLQVNAPGASSTRAFQVVADNGGTHAEPGHALTATTPLHLYDDTAPERPAMVYLNEVSHVFEGNAYVFGGGFYACDSSPVQGDSSAFDTKPWVCRAFVGRSGQDILNTKVPVDIGSFFARTRNATDYYGGTLCPEEPIDVHSGDTVVYGFRPQAFTMRANVAVIDRVETEPRVLGVFDRANNLLDPQGLPYEDSKRRVLELMESIDVPGSLGSLA
jgi:predicted amino acid racemase